MRAIDLLQTHLMEECPFIHSKGLQAVMDAACSLQKKQNLSLTAIGKGLCGGKHKIKKVDRLEGNRQLYEEIASMKAFPAFYLSTLPFRKMLLF